MREITYKARNKANTEWIPVGSLEFFEDYGILLNEEIPQSDFILIQYTGLKDKNKKKIYEGDIVVIPNEYPFFDYPEGVVKDMTNPLEGEIIPNYRGIVEWMYSQWQVVLHCVNSSKKGFHDGINRGLNNCGFEEGENTHWEIIGNIYDNPELLENGYCNTIYI